MTDQDRCTDTNPHPAHRTQYGGFGVIDCPGVPMTRPEELREERVTTGRLEGDLRSQTRAVRELTAERDAARQELGAAGEVLAVVRDAVERIDRALATYDTTPGETPVEPAGDDQAEEDDLRSPLTAERDKLVETIGRLVSLPPEQIAEMHKVGYSGTAALGSADRRAQEPQRGEFCHVHFSWLCQAGQGRCQNDDEARP